MNVNPYNTTEYENKSNWTLGESKPNSNPIKPCPERSRMGQFLQKPKMNVNSFIIKDYRKKDDFAVQKNKPNSNSVLSAVECANFRKAQNERKLICYKGL
jgi:hypothetical protein